LLLNLRGDGEAHLSQRARLAEQDHELLLVVNLQDAVVVDLHELPRHGQFKVVVVQILRGVLAPVLEQMFLEASTLLDEVGARFHNPLPSLASPPLGIEVNSLRHVLDPLRLDANLPGDSDAPNLVAINVIQTHLHLPNHVAHPTPNRPQEALHALPDPLPAEQILVPAPQICVSHTRV